MCYRVVEIYSACRCLYHSHPIDTCAAYRQFGHFVQNKTVLVGYACGIHDTIEPLHEEAESSKKREAELSLALLSLEKEKTPVKSSTKDKGSGTFRKLLRKELFPDDSTADKKKIDWNSLYKTEESTSTSKEGGRRELLKSLDSADVAQQGQSSTRQATDPSNIASGSTPATTSHDVKAKLAIEQGLPKQPLYTGGFSYVHPLPRISAVLEGTQFVPKEQKLISQMLTPSVISSDDITEPDSTGSFFSGLRENRFQSLSGTLSGSSSIQGIETNMKIGGSIAPRSAEGILATQDSRETKIESLKKLGTKFVSSEQQDDSNIDSSLKPLPIKKSKSPQISFTQSSKSPNFNDVPESKDSETDNMEGVNTPIYTPTPSTTPESESSSSDTKTSESPDFVTSALDDFIFRIRNPSAYLDRLQDLETAVFEGSTAEIYFPSTERGYGNMSKGPLVADYPRSLSLKKAQAAMSDTDALAFLEGQDLRKRNDLGAILESRNVLAKAVINMIRLQDAGYCGSYISILTADNCRENIVRLIPILSADIVVLLSQFEDCLRKVLIEDHSPSQQNNDITEATRESSGQSEVEEALKEDIEKEKLLQTTPGEFIHDNNSSDESDLSNYDNELFSVHTDAVEEEADNINEENPDKSAEVNCVRDLVNSCVEILQRVIPISREDILERQYIAAIRLTAHLIDLAILSYSGAHVNDFGKHCALETPRIFDLLSPFSGILFQKDEDQLLRDDYTADEEDISIQMQRCHLQCLDAFHDNEPVWVFSSPFWTPTSKLLLWTSLEQFADIWGPLWKAKSLTPSTPGLEVDDDENENLGTMDDYGHLLPSQGRSSYLHYVVGNGRIVKWPQSEYAPILHTSEVFCHWISNREDVDWVGERPETVPFDGTEIMIIGAFVIGNNNLLVNSKCQQSMGLARKRLIDSGKLHIHGAAEPYLYKDSVSYQLQVGYSGVNASAGIQYKKIPGRNLKGILVEQWAMFPDIRRPELLEDLYGLEVSMCTKNARRIQLSELLSRGCMRNLLQSFPWPSDDYREEYFKTLETNCFAKLQSDAVFRTIFGEAVLISLCFLKETGVNHENQLLVFLSSPATPKPELAALALKEHSWIGLLRDSPGSCALAMFGDNCLEFKHEKGSSCGNPGRSTLRTSLIMNKFQPPPFLRINALSSFKGKSVEKDEVIWGSWWCITEQKAGKRMWLGKNGTLSVSGYLTDETLLVDWRASPATLGFKKLMRKTAAPHREYLEIDRSPVEERVRPLPVFVLAEPRSQDFYI